MPRRLVLPGHVADVPESPRHCIRHDRAQSSNLLLLVHLQLGGASPSTGRSAQAWHASCEFKDLERPCAGVGPLIHRV
jgi:hypothetical protein